EQELAAERARIAARLRKRAELESGVAVAARSLEHAESALASLQADDAGSDQAITRATEAVEAAQDRLRACESGETQLDEAHEEAAAAVQQLADQHAALVEERTAARTTRSRLEAQAEGQRASSRLTAGLADLLDADLTGLRGAVAERLTIVPGCELATTAALGTLSGAVLATDRDAALAALDHVGEDGLLDVVHPESPDASRPTPAAPTATEAPGPG